MTTLGFLGLGTMGAAMAGRLLETGHAVTVWNRSAEPVESLVAAGATRAATPAEALAAPVSFSMFANDEVAESVLTADAFAGAPDRAQPGRIHVNTASVSADAADRLAAVAAASGVGYLSSPVLGRSTVAAAGQLNVMVAGDPAHVDAVAPYLADLGKRIWRFGDRPRMANVVKAAANYDIIHAIQALGESIALVEAHGVDGGEFVELLTNSLFGGLVYEVYGGIIAEQRYKPAGFTMSLGLKDLGLAEDVAAEAGVTLPSAPVLRELFEIALRDPELKDADWGALAEVTRRGLSTRSR